MSTRIATPAPVREAAPAAALAKPLPRLEPKRPPAVSIVKGFHLPELDGLRGFAALGAVLFHYLGGPSKTSPFFDDVRSVLEFSPGSVDTFFVLSGFLIGGILLRAKDSPRYYQTFYLRRAYRILPLYYLWLVVCLSFLYFAPGWGVTPLLGYRFSFVAVAFVLFFHNFVPVIVKSSFIASPTWTLAVEEHFYLVAPAVVRRLSQRRLIQVLIGVIVFVPLLRGILFKVVAHGADWSLYANYMWTFCRVDALAMGVLLAVIWNSPEKQAKLKQLSRFLLPSLVALTALGCLGQFLNDHHVPYTYTLAAAFGRTTTEMSCAALLLLALTRPTGAFGRFLKTSFMKFLGKISYCLYLVHWGVLWILTRFVFDTRFGQSLRNDVLLALVAFGISVFIARLSLKYFEEPLIRRAHRYSY